MTLYEAKKPYLVELGLLERYSWSEEFKDLHYLDQAKILNRIHDLEPYVELLTSIQSPGQKPKPVVMYNLDLEMLRVFNSVQDVATYFGLGKTIAPIRRVLELERLKYQEYTFRYANSTLPFLKSPKFQPDGKGKPVCQLRINYKTGTHSEIREFPSIKKAAEFINPNSISSASEGISLCCQNKKKSYKGYAWKFKNRSRASYD